MRAILTALFLCGVALEATSAADTNRHVVLVVWDGMRPDFVNETNTPTLHALAQRGVFFRNNHCVYLSSTEVNGTALATGSYPQRSDIIANREFRPAINANQPIAMESLKAMRKGDELGGFVAVPTLAEILHAHGRRTAIAGSKPVVLLHDRAARADDATNVVVFEGETLPAAALAGIREKLGPFPQPADTKTNLDLWTTRALIGSLWSNGVPDFSLLWLAEPDASQHATSPGSPRARAAIRNSDYALSLMLAALKEKGVDETTDVLVVSDHAFSTIVRNVNVAARLQQAGFRAFREFNSPPARGDIMVAGLGGSVLLYVIGHDRKTTDLLVEFLQTQDFAGVILTPRARAGTLALDEARINSADAADVVFSFRWTAATNAYGVPGYVIADGQGTSSPTAGSGSKGTHVSLSPFDLHNTLVAAGPDFRRGFVSETPSGNVDVAPTILHLLGVSASSPMDGRVLTEALAGAKTKRPKVKTRELSARNKFPNGKWTEALSVSEVNGVRYLESGSGQFTPAK